MFWGRVEAGEIFFLLFLEAFGVSTPDDTPWDGGMVVVSILFLLFLEAFHV